jgi:predicted TPR repeat methyltransferase
MRKLDLAQALAEAFGHLEANRVGEAKRLARDLERAQPSLPGLRYLQGLLAMAEGDGRKAAQSLAKALAQTPDAVPPLLAMARAQALQQRHRPAEMAYVRLIALSPALAEAYDELGALYLACGRMEAAVGSLDRATTLRPKGAGAWYRLGIAQRSLGHWEAAARSFAQTIAVDDKQAKAYASLAGVLRRLKRASESVGVARQAVRLEPAEASHWLELGQAEREGGDLDAAIAAFREVMRLASDDIEALWLSAECLNALGRQDDAVAAYRRVLTQDPADRFGAALALAQCGALPPPGEASPTFIRTLFDQYADGFDRDLVEGLNYRGPAILIDAIGRTLGLGPFDAFDVGCGTGLLGVGLRPMTGRLDGVDLSPRMIAKARERRLYDELGEGDLVAALNLRPAAYDLVAAADVLIYLGDLRAVFEAAAAALRDGGGFAFTVEAHKGDGYVLLESRRFAHSLSYLRQQAAPAGFVSLLQEETATRDDRGQPVPGYVVVMRKTTSAPSRS